MYIKHTVYTISVCISLSLSLYIYTYIYIYMPKAVWQYPRTGLYALKARVEALRRLSRHAARR